MIIHNPKISGSLQFPSDENGNLISLTVENGTLETKTLNSSGVDQSIQPAVNYSGSFTGSFVGDGSSLTGVSAINIDALSSLGGATVAQGDNLVVSDAGTEKKVTFSNLEDSVFGNVSGDVVIAAGGVATIQANSVALTTDTTGDYVGTITGGTGITSTAATSGEGTTHSLSVDAAQTQITSVGTIGTGTWQGTTIAVNQGGTGVTTKTGTGNVVLSSSPTLVTPALGTPSALVGTNISGTAANLTVGATTGVEAGADVTDTANVTAAGALMDSELAGIAAVKATTGTFLTADQTKLDTIETNADVTDAANVLTSLPAGVVSGSDQVATTFAQTILDDASAAAVRTTIGVDAAGTVNYTLPTNLAGDDIDIDTTALTGATVISDLDINITTNTSGLVTDANATVATRTLTATNLSLGNVTNESKATMFATPTFTGVPISTTPSANDDSTKIATTAYVQGELTDLLGGAPAAYDTLLEISASISNGDSDVVALTTTVGTKLAKASNLSDLANASTARTNLGVAIGSDVQAYNSTLAAVAGSTYTGDNAITTLGTIGTGTWNGTLIHDDYLSANTVHLDTTQTLSGAKTFSSAVNISDSTASTTKTTGALIVTGGVGISGALNVGGDIVAFASSDERLKDNIELISNPIEKVQSLKGVTWDWNSNADELQQSLPNVGVIAQDVEKVLPQLVTDRDNGFKGVDYAKLTGLLIEAIKDQQKQIEELKNKIS